MRIVHLCLVAFFATFAVGCDGCRKEPAIVIRFEPIDASGSTPSADAKPAASGDLASAAKADAPKADAPKADEKKPDEAKKASACTKDSECVLEDVECCSCSAGGKQHAVHKQDKRTAAQQKQKCGDTMCTQALSTDPSCTQKPACIKGECALK